MKTLAVVDGDLTISSGSYLLFSGGDKIRQDLTMALQEHYGFDRYHPGWGSVIDSFIGEALTSDIEQRVLNEVARVLRNYITAQADQINSDTLAGVRSSLDTSDVVAAVQDIKVASNGDTLTVQASLITMSRETITVTRTVVS